MRKGKLFSKIFGIALVFVLIGAVLGALPASVEEVEASPGTIYVPDDYSTIQAAVDAASPGDTIIVRDGTYTENIDVNTDNLIIKSENGVDSTIVQAANSNDHVFEVTADYVKISGFMVKGATGQGGIYLNAVNQCDISSNRVTNNYWGICLYSSSHNALTNNTCSGNVAGIHLSRSSNNTISNNAANSNSGHGIYPYDSSNNTIYANNFNNTSKYSTNVHSCSSTNTWHSPEEVTYTYNGNSYTNYLGNYWDDYTGSDADGDGIGDTPYTILDYTIAANSDNYPLMEPFENYGIGPGPRTWYVDDDLVDYPSADFTKIQEAVDAASLGDSIIVYPGTYTENVNMNKDHLTIQSENGAEATIVQAADSDDHVFEVAADYVNINGFTVEGATESQKAGIYLNYADHCEISNNVILNSSYGIYLINSSCNNISSNAVNSCTESGIILDYSPTPGPYLPPIGYNDPDDQWEDETLAYDENRDTFASVYACGVSCSSWLELLAPSEKSLGIRFWIDSSSQLCHCRIELFYEGNWHYLEGWPAGSPCPPKGEWVVVDYPEKKVEKARCNFYRSSISSGCSQACLSEFQFKTALDVSSSNNEIVQNTVSNNGVGIRLYHSSGNRIYFNKFINNTDNGYSSDSTNFLNSPEETTYTYKGNTYTNYLGNYWSDYGIYLPAVGNNDPDNQWENEELAYDENRDTYARVYLSGGRGSSWLELFTPSGETQGIRFWGSGGPLRVDIYYDGYWHCLRDWPWGISSAPANQWVELTYPSEIVEKARIMFHGRVLNGWSYLNEFQFKTALDKSVFDVDGDGGGDRPYSIDSDNDDYPLMEPFENYVIGPPPIDTTPPNTEITSGPSGTIDYNDVTFTWIGSDDVTPTSELVYRYCLEGYDSDWSDWTLDTSKSYADLRDGHYTFKAKAKDQATNIDPSPAVRPFTVAVKWGKYVKVIPEGFLPGSEIGAKASYNWVGIDEQGKDIFQIYKIEGWSHYFVGAYRISIESESGILWSKLIPATPLWMTCYPEELYAYAKDWISVKAYGFTEKEVLGLWSIIAKMVGIPTPPPGGLPFFIGHDENYLAPPYIDTSDFPAIAEEGEVYPMILGSFCSPGELRIYDTQGHVTGLVNGEVREDIPNSAYFNGIFVIPSLNDSYRYEVVGTEEKEYKLGVLSVEAEEANTFIATDIPTTSEATHQYSIDWDALSQGEEGVTVQIDSDGDGVFEDKFTSDEELTQDEFMAQFQGCFIATAAYGNPMAEEIEILREFRDEYLLTSPVGQGLVEFYYKVSPPMAEFITEHPSLKPIVRVGLLPAVAMSTVVVNTTPAEKMAMVGLLALVSVVVVAIWVTRRRRRGSEYT